MVSNQGKVIVARQARGGPGHLQLTRHTALCAAGIGWLSNEDRQAW